MPGDYAKLESDIVRPISPVSTEDDNSNTITPREAVSRQNVPAPRLSQSSSRTSLSSKDALDHLSALDDPLDIADAGDEYDDDDNDQAPLFGAAGSLLTDHEAGLTREARSRRSGGTNGDSMSSEEAGYRLPTDGGGILNSFFNM